VIARCLVSMCLAIGPSLALACSPFIEEHPTSSSASFRPHTTAFEHCAVDETTYRRVVAAWLQNRPTGSARITSLALGRAVAFPWLSQYIADSALAVPDWAAQMAKAKPGEREKLAAKVLLDSALLRRLAVPFEGTGYVVRSVSYEKVLFGRAEEHSSRPSAGATLVPFDAQLWLQLSPRD
jgi:hypothetical protein